MFDILENSFHQNCTDNFFCNPTFYKKISSKESVYFELKSKNQIAAKIFFSALPDSKWRSPGRGTYSGYVFDDNLPISDLFSFHQSVCQTISKKGGKYIEILLPPQSHDPVSFSKQFYMLLSDGFFVSRCDLNYSLNINSDNFLDRISYGNIKRCKKCSREGWIANQLPTSSLIDVYKTIETNRKSKGNVVSMALTELQEMVELFPDKYVLFGIEVNSILIASAICIRVSKNVLYVFYWGDLPGYNSFSPIVLLAKSIYEYCQREKIQFLDIGTSTIGSQMNEGLMKFKSGLGFSESIKVQMSKTINLARGL